MDSGRESIPLGMEKHFLKKLQKSVDSRGFLRYTKQAVEREVKTNEKFGKLLRNSRLYLVN